MSKISVITITKDNYPDLELTLKSLQPYLDDKRVELIVVDGSAVPDTALIEKLKQKCQNLKYVLESNRGISLAFNVGIQHAVNEWIYFLNSGDELLKPDSLLTMVDEVAGNINLCYGISEIYDLQKKKIIATQGTKITSWPPLRMPFNHQSVLYRKNIFTDRGNYSTRYKLAMDYEHLLRCNEKEIFFFPYVISRFYIGGSSSNKADVYDEWLEALIANGYPTYKAYYLNYYYKLRLFVKSLIFRG